LELCFSEAFSQGVLFGSAFREYFLGGPSRRAFKECLSLVFSGSVFFANAFWKCGLGVSFGGVFRNCFWDCVWGVPFKSVFWD
jgi:hypothetical protein